MAHKRIVSDVGVEPTIDRRSNALPCSGTVEIGVRVETLPNVCAYLLGELWNLTVEVEPPVRSSLQLFKLRPHVPQEVSFNVRFVLALGELVVFLLLVDP